MKNLILMTAIMFIGVILAVLSESMFGLCILGVTTFLAFVVAKETYKPTRP